MDVDSERGVRIGRKQFYTILLLLSLVAFQESVMMLGLEDGLLEPVAFVGGLCGLAVGLGAPVYVLYKLVGGSRVVGFATD